MAETDLAALPATLVPELWPKPDGYPVWEGGNPRIEPFATVRGAEGMTVVARLAEMQAAGLTGALGKDGISSKVTAGLFHDHRLVQRDRRGDALRVLGALSCA
ncbi:MAG: hypothetical protein JNK19_00935 [Tabrizicola sp.]|nr:hypothetical protein [Tabrizicola sp.]